MAIKSAAVRPEAPVQPKPQIPTMLAVVQRALEVYQTNTEVLETRLVSIMRPGEVRSDGIKATLSASAPVAETLSKYAAVLTSLNARIKSVMDRLEV